MNNTPGQRFGRWVIVEIPPHRRGVKMAVCRCDCGEERLVSLGNLARGITTSCGCWRRDRMAEIARDRISETPSYAAVHARLRRSRGPASGSPCMDCGGPAKDWSLRRGTLDIVTAIDVSGVTRRYSVDLDDYEPRCKSCHSVYDRLPSCQCAENSCKSDIVHR